LQGSGENLPFSNASFDLVTCTDVLEHITNDDSTVREINRVLKPGGYVLITVPAFQSLWGHQDEVSHHLRRYTRRDIEKIVTKEGFEILESFYFNWIMFLPVWIIRLISRLVSFKMRSEGDINSPILNKMMMFVFRLDCILARRIPFPFGVSVLVFARSTAHT
jgi:SAM-dependent methyltransferase